jgi:hypothetical protein
MVRLITLLFVITVLYLVLTKEQIEPEALGYTPSIITVEELPDKGNE